MWGVAASSPALRKSCPHRAQGLPFTQTSGATQHQGAQLLLCDGQAHLWVEGAILCHWLWSGLNLRHLQCEISAKLCDGRCLLERLKTPSLSPEEPRTQAFPHWHTRSRAQLLHAVWARGQNYRCFGKMPRYATAQLSGLAIGARTNLRR